MSDQLIALGPVEEADRLWEAAERSWQIADTNVTALLETVDFGIRAAEILAVEHLHQVRSEFPATIAALLDKPSPEVDAYRDAVHMPNSVGFTEVIDLLSEDEADCVAPSMHRGWEDRRFSCRRSRATARQALSYSIPADDQAALVLLSAYRNRVFRLPPPVLIDLEEVRKGFDPLQRLYSALRAG